MFMTLLDINGRWICLPRRNQMFLSGFEGGEKSEKL